MDENSVKQIPCREGLWSMPSSRDDKPKLIGSKFLKTFSKKLIGY